MIHAYNKMYLPMVMKNLAALFDIATNAEDLEADKFGSIFASSDVARQIENAVPNMLAGKSATEMLALILKRDVQHTVIPMGKTPEYWAGRILAITQWELNKTFTEILDVLPLSTLISFYHPYHEADDHKVIDIIKQHFPQNGDTLKLLT